MNLVYSAHQLGRSKNSICGVRNWRGRSVQRVTDHRPRRRAGRAVADLSGEEFREAHADPLARGRDQNGQR
jgi:hypothetical protein